VRSLVDQWYPDDGLERMRAKHAIYGAWFRREVGVELDCSFAVDAERFARTLAQFPHELAGEIDEYARYPGVPVEIRASLLESLASIGWSRIDRHAAGLEGADDAVGRLVSLGANDVVERLRRISAASAFIAGGMVAAEDVIPGARLRVWRILADEGGSKCARSRRFSSWHSFDSSSGARNDRDIRNGEYQELMDAYVRVRLDEAAARGDRDELAAVMWEAVLFMDLPRRAGRPHVRPRRSAAEDPISGALRRFLALHRPSCEEFREMADAIDEMAEISRDPTTGAVAMHRLLLLAWPLFESPRDSAISYLTPSEVHGIASHVGAMCVRLRAMPGCEGMGVPNLDFEDPFASLDASVDLGPLDLAAPSSLSQDES